MKDMIPASGAFLSCTERRSHKRNGISLLFLGGLIALSLCPLTYAAPTSTVTTNVQATFCESQIVQTTSHTDALSGTASLGGAGYGTQVNASATGGNSPAISASASAFGYTDFSTGYVYAGCGLAQEDYTYYYMIATPDPTPREVPVHAVFQISGDAGITVGQYGMAHYSASVAFGNVPGVGGLSYTVNRMTGDLGESSSGATGLYEIDMTSWTNMWNPVVLEANAQVYAMNDGLTPPASCFANVSVDPTITMDAAWLNDHPGSTIEFDTVPVPEPGTVLLLGGFVAVAALGRRGKRDIR